MKASIFHNLYFDESANAWRLSVLGLKNPDGTRDVVETRYYATRKEALESL